jgi:hypothetical protein
VTKSASRPASVLNTFLGRLDSRLAITPFDPPQRFSAHRIATPNGGVSPASTRSERHFVGQRCCVDGLLAPELSVGTARAGRVQPRRVSWHREVACGLIRAAAQTAGVMVAIGSRRREPAFWGEPCPWAISHAGLCV